MPLESPWPSSLAITFSALLTSVERESTEGQIGVQILSWFESCCRMIDAWVVCWYWLSGKVIGIRVISLKRASCDLLLCQNPRPRLSRNVIFVHTPHLHNFFYSLSINILLLLRSLSSEVGGARSPSGLFFSFSIHSLWHWEERYAMVSLREDS